MRLFGDGAIALRTPSAIAGVLTVQVAWAIGGELCGRRCALLAAALVAVNPLFVWYSQEARVYALFVLTSALALLCFLRARREPTPAHMAGFAVAASLALLSHYFALFLLVPMALSLLASRSTRRATLPAIAALCAVGAALLPLVIAQGGHGTQWLGRWGTRSRVYSSRGGQDRHLSRRLVCRIHNEIAVHCLGGSRRLSGPENGGCACCAPGLDRVHETRSQAPRLPRCFRFPVTRWRSERTGRSGHWSTCHDRVSTSSD